MVVERFDAMSGRKVPEDAFVVYAYDEDDRWISSSQLSPRSYPAVKTVPGAVAAIFGRSGRAHHVSVWAPDGSFTTHEKGGA
jgi:hypothetical protein